MIPGITCKPLPICPKEDSKLDLRGDQHIPGLTCIPRQEPAEPVELPPCPIEVDSEYDLLDIRSGEEVVPGVTCKPLPECPGKEDKIDLRGAQHIPGLTCIPRQEPSEEDLSPLLDIRTSGMELIPGMTY